MPHNNKQQNPKDNLKSKIALISFLNLTIGAVIIEDRRLEDNLSRKERYHCYSLDAAQFVGEEYADRETPETKMEREMETEHIAQALDGLSSQLYPLICRIAGDACPVRPL